MRELDFKVVEKKLRKNKFGFLSSITAEGRVHVAGIVYAVSLPGKKFCLYGVTGADVKKTRNIRNNPEIAFGIPFTHHLIRFAPDFCIQFQGRAEILPFDDKEGQEAIKTRFIMKKMLNSESMNKEDNVILKIIPDKKIHGFGLGINLIKMLKNIGMGRFISIIPDEIF